jgi:protein ImuB
MVETPRSAIRMAVVWCPDWPVVAWGIPLDEPAVVVVGNRVIASSPAARREGVALGQRRRDAQGRCPDVAVLERDTDREARLFEPVAAALEGLTPRVEVAGPGVVAFPTRGPSRFFGGDDAMAARVLDDVGPVLSGRGEARVGVADGIFAARLAARSSEAVHGPVIVPTGTSASFLQPFPITALEHPELTDVLVRLGLRTLGEFAALASSDVVGRFGRTGQIAHRRAGGEDDHPPDLRRPAPDLAVTWMFEPAAERIDRCAFAAKALADELHGALTADGLACIRIAIEAETDSGEEHVRLWRHEGALSAAAIADRARWQLDGWLGSAARRVPEVNQIAESGHGIRRLTLIPDEVVPATGRQLGFWGGRAERADDVTRVVARLQGLLGAEAVSVPEWRGGRTSAEQISLVPAAAVDLGEERPATSSSWVDQPWPGRMPAPSPAMVFVDPVEARVVDAVDRPVRVSGRGELSAPPDRVIVDARSLSVGTSADRRHRSPTSTRSVTAWAGPWPAEERWWDPASARRRARLQVVFDDDTAHLLVMEQGSWYVEASYR